MRAAGPHWRASRAWYTYAADHGRELTKLGLQRIANDQVPDHLFVRDTASFHHAGFLYGPEEAAFCDARDGRRLIHAGSTPAGTGDRTDAVTLADQIGEHPAGFTLLLAFAFKTQKLCPALAPADEQGKDGTIALVAKRLWIGR